MYPPRKTQSDGVSETVLVRLNNSPLWLRTAQYSYTSRRWVLLINPGEVLVNVTEWWPIPPLGTGITDTERAEAV
mgnify:CR=1 FL=1